MPNHRTVSVVQPTQVARPWRATVRSLFELALALCSLIPLVVANVYTDVEQAPAIVAQVVVVMGVITRVMALPVVEAFLRDFVPWLAADPAPARITVVAEAEPVVIEDAAARGERGESTFAVIFAAAFLGALVAVLLLRLL